MVIVLGGWVDDSNSNRNISNNTIHVDNTTSSIVNDNSNSKDKHKVDINDNSSNDKSKVVIVGWVDEIYSSIIVDWEIRSKQRGSNPKDYSLKAQTSIYKGFHSTFAALVSY